MQLYGVFLIVLGLGLAYLLGLITANWYHRKAEEDKRYALERQFLRIRAGTDYYDPAGPYLARPLTSGQAIRGTRIPQSKAFTPAQLDEFEARLKDNGQAVLQLGKNPTTTKNKK